MKQQPDRISYSLGMKVNLGNYESADFHISLSSDVESGETNEQALSRLQSFVEDACAREFEKLKEAKK